MADLYDVNNVVVGKAVLWLAPWDAVTPPDPPADTVALFDVYPSPWKGAGGTDEGFKITIDANTQDINIEEQSTPVARNVDTRTVTIEAALAEDTMQSMQWAYGGNVVTTAAGTGQPGKSVLTLNDDLQVWSAVLETKNSFALPRRYFIPKMVSAGSVEVSFRRAAAKRMYPLTLGSICATGDMQFTEITAPASA